MLVLASPVLAATPQPPAGTIEGVVTDSLTGVPIAAAVVRVDGTTISGHTKPDGSFRIAVPAGTQWLDVSLAGYGRARPRVNVRAGEVTTIAVALVPGATPYLETVEVRPGANPADAAAPSVRSLDSTDLEHLRGILADDPFRAVHTLPGVVSGDDFQSEFFVRASDSRHLGISMDGISIPWPLHAVRGRTDTGSIAVINSDALDRLTLESGSYAQRAGTRTGGWVDFSLRDGSRKSLSTRAAASVTNASIMVEGPVAAGRGSWLASTRRSYLNWLLHQIDTDTDAAALGFFDQQARFVFDMTPAHQFQVSAIAGRAGYDEVEESPGANSLHEADSYTAVVTAGVRSLYSNTTILQRIGLVTQGFDNTGEFSQTLGNGRIRELLYNASLATRLSPRVLLESGAEFRHQRESRTLGFFGRRGGSVFLENEVSFSGSGWLPAAHAHLTWQASPAVTISPGLRVAHSTLTNHTTFGPWLQAMWRRGRADVKVAAGLYPQFAEFDQVLSIVGTRDLAPERARHVDVTFGLIAAGLRWQATAYDRNERDMIRLEDSEPRALDGVLIAPNGPRYQNALSGFARGVELTVEGSRGRLSGWASYAYGRARYTDWLTGETFWSDYDQRHTMNLVARYQVSPATGLGAKWRYGSNVPVPGYLVSRHGTWFASDRRNESRFPVYSRLDIRADRVFTFRKSNRLTLFAEVVNVFDRTNLGPSDPSIRTRTLEAVGVTETLMPRIPAVGVLFTF